VWSYPLKTRTGPEVAAAVKTFLTRDLPPLRVQLQHFQSDGGSELMGEQVRELLREHGISTRHSGDEFGSELIGEQVRELLREHGISTRHSGDEFSARAEIKPRVTCMLLHSTLPLPF
jgi:hypothetical protein